MKLLQPAIALLLLLSSCLPREAKEEPVTQQEAMDFSQKIDSSIKNKLSTYYNSLINIKVFTEKIATVSGQKVSDDIIRGVEDGLEKTDLGMNIIRAINDNGIYQLVKQYEKDNKQHLLFRLYSDAGLNYHDYELTKRKGEVGIADMYVYLSGEDLSKTMGDLLVSFTKLKGDHESEALVQAKSVKKMKELYQEGDIEKAKEYYQQLPESLRKQKALQIMYIQISAKISDEAYMEAIKNYQELYPSEANINLLQLDYYITQQDYRSSMESIDKLDAKINTDPFLDYIRGLISNLMKDREQAIIYLEKLHKNMPGYGDGVLELIAQYMDAGDDMKANQLIAEYRSNTSFDQEKLEFYLSMKPNLTPPQQN